MQDNQHKAKGMFNVSNAELKELFSVHGNAEGKTKALLIFIGTILTPFTLLGIIIFYQKGYRLFMEPNNETPRLHNLPPIVRVGMIIGAVLIWVVFYLIAQVVLRLIFWLGGDYLQHYPAFVPIFLLVNLIITSFVWMGFSTYRGHIYKYLAEKKRHGSSRFATKKELEPYRKPRGFYIGAGAFYPKAGHMLTAAGTRAGKGVNLILQNLLMPWLFKNKSFVIVDPKGELTAISANQQRKAGRKVIILNPWDLLALGSTGYNPLDILKSDWSNLSDDVQMIAESMVPAAAGSEENHFQDRARSFISTLLLHLVTAAPEKERHLGTLWSWLRLEHNQWIELLADMITNNDPNVGDIVKAGANEITSLMKNSDREFGSVMSTAHKCTDFIKSPPLRKSLQGNDGFTSGDLISENTTVYLCIPFDRLKVTAHG